MPIYHLLCIYTFPFAVVLSPNVDLAERSYGIIVCS